MKRFLYMAAVLLVLAGCKRADRVVEPTPEPGPGTTPDEQPEVEMLNLTIRHSMAHLNSPTWEGDGVQGSVDWGDGCVEPYVDGLSHDYSAVSSFDAVFQMADADSFTIEQLGEIEHLEIRF